MATVRVVVTFDVESPKEYRRTPMPIATKDRAVKRFLQQVMLMCESYDDTKVELKHSVVDVPERRLFS